MLVLTRRVGESIIINNDIRVTVVALGNGRVKIGIEAPQGISVDRQEIHDRKMAEQAPSEPMMVAATTASTTESGMHNRIEGLLNTAAADPRKPR